MRCVSNSKIVVVIILITIASPCLSAVIALISLNPCLSAKPTSPRAPSVRTTRDYQSDVCNVRVVRHVEVHPDAWRLWQPVIAQSNRKHLVVAFGAMIHGKKDMGDIFVSVSRKDGGTWSKEKTFFHAGIKNSYPTLIEVAPRDYRAVWGSGTSDTQRTHIHFGKLRIAP